MIHTVFHGQLHENETHISQHKSTQYAGISVIITFKNWTKRFSFETKALYHARHLVYVNFALNRWN